MSSDRLRQWIGWSVIGCLCTVFVFIAGGACTIAMQAHGMANDNTTRIEGHIGIDDQRYKETMRRLVELKDGQDRLQDTLDRKHP